MGDPNMSTSSYLKAYGWQPSNHGEEGVGGRQESQSIRPSSNWLATPGPLACQHIVRLALSLSCWWQSLAVAIKDARARKVKSMILSQSIETPMSCDEVEFPTWKLNVELSFTLPPRRAA